MLTFEFSEPTTSTCDCCGGQTTCLTRFVHKHGNAHAIYYAAFSDNHPDRIVKVAVSLGEWGDGSGSEDRIAFALDLRCVASQYEVMVTDASASLWSEAKVIGLMLDREEALAHQWIEEVFHITDHMVLEDEPLKAYLDAKVPDGEPSS